MKINKIFAAILCLMTIVLGSCKEDTYSPAEMLQTAQVYFPSDGQSVYDLVMANDYVSVSVPLHRVKTDDKITVNVTATGADGDTIKVAKTVTFEEGSNAAMISIDVKTAALDYEHYRDITLSIADEAYTTPYGYSSKTIYVGVPAPWTPWYDSYKDWTADGNSAEQWPLSKTVDNTTGTYTYVNYWTGDDPGLPISYRQSTLDPTQGQFMIENWGAGNPLVFDYNTETGIIRLAQSYYLTENSSYGSVYVSDAIYYWWDIRQDTDLSEYPEYQSYYDKESGKFYLMFAYWVEAGSFGYDCETFQCDGFYIPDYSVVASYRGILTDTGGLPYAQAIISRGADAEKVVAVVVNSSDDAGAVADAVAAGDLEGMELDFNGGDFGLFDIPLDGATGELQLVLVTVVDGAVAGISSIPFEYYGGGSNPWVSLGKCLYTDDFVSGLYTEDGPITYEVEILESTETPGRYRLVNPYGEAFPLNEPGDYDPSATTYVEIDATDPDAVFIPTQYIGIDYGQGPMYICTEGARYLESYDKETLKGAGYLGTLENGVITFPVFETQSGAGYQGIIYLGEKGYYGGMNGSVKIVLPEAVKASAKARANKAKAVKRTSRVHGTMAPKTMQVNKNLVKKSLKK